MVETKDGGWTVLIVLAFLGHTVPSNFLPLYFVHS